MPPAVRVPRAGDVRAALARIADPERAKGLARFFKTGPGDYGEGDVFIGVRVPDERAVARKFRDLSLGEIERLLHSRIHEERQTALLILVDRYERGDATTKAACVRFYVDNLAWVNNWDLVDSTAHQILGDHLLTGDRRRLLRLARSRVLWERRVAMVATYAFIVAGDSGPAFDVARLLLADDHDLIHKAVGWMLREVGKRVGERELRAFLEEHATAMPRTALRYAIERFAVKERRAWMDRPHERNRSR